MAIKNSMTNFMLDMVNGEVIDMNNPNCTNCNDCCSMGTMLLKDEFEYLKKYLKSKDGKPIYIRAKKLISKYYESRTVYWLCPFSSDRRKCLIYEKRPQICRDFHCSKELSVNYDKSVYESSEHYSMYMLFKPIFDEVISNGRH